MPMYETAFPVGSTNLKVTSNGVDYALVVGVDTFDRIGVDGWLDVILPLCGGDEFVGEVLEGQWKKGWSTGMDADQAFTAIIDSGLLKFKGEADIAGTHGYGWVKSTHPVPMMNGTEVTVELEVPISDVVAGANRAIYFRFFLTEVKDVTERPSLNDNSIYVEIHVTNNGLLMTVAKSIDDADDDLYTGSTYIDGSGVSETADKFTIWRIVFHDGVAGATSPGDVRHMHVYLKQDVDRPTTEGATENELSNSPYDISDILFNVGYPAYQINTQNVDYFDDGTEAISTYFRVKYPSEFSLKYDFPDADYGKGEVELWDTKGSATESDWQRVFDEDHDFGTGDAVLQNGLIRVYVDRLVNDGLKAYYWTGAAWVQPINSLTYLLATSSVNPDYPVVSSIDSVTLDKTALNIRLHEDGTADEDFYIDVLVTLERGKLYFEIDLQTAFPLQEVVAQWTKTAPRFRFGYVGDDEIGDDDLAIDGTNTTLTDNFMLQLDDAGTAILGVVFSNIQPTANMNCFDGGFLGYENVAVADIIDTILYYAIIPFALIANLFEEAEDATLGGGATAVGDGAASGGQAALLNAQNETVIYRIVAGTELPEGRYLAVYRVRDINQVAGDVALFATNSTDTSRREEEGAEVPITVTATYAYYSVVFDITAADVIGTDDIDIGVKKLLADANEIYVDYFLIIPIGDGESFPQDLAHAAMRKQTQPKRVFQR